MILCRDCSEPVDKNEEEWDTCGECGRGLCSECCQRQHCEVCNELLNKGEAAEDCCCKGCMEICEECKNDGNGFSVVVHKSCMAEHVKNCLARKNPTERALASAVLTIRKEEITLKEAKEELAKARCHWNFCNQRVQDIEGRLSAALEQKVKAEHELKKQEEG